MDPKNYRNQEAGQSILTPTGFWAFIPKQLPPDIAGHCLSFRPFRMPSVIWSDWQLYLSGQFQRKNISKKFCP